jgi:hypothetical protein
MEDGSSTAMDRLVWVFDSAQDVDLIDLALLHLLHGVRGEENRLCHVAGV